MRLRTGADRGRVGGTTSNTGMPGTGSDAATESGPGVNPLRRAAFIGLPAGVAFALAGVFMIVRAMPRYVNPAVPPSASEMNPSASLSSGGRTLPTSPTQAGEIGLVRNELDAAKQAAPASSPAGPTAAVRSDPLPPSLVDIVRRVAPSVATIFVKETDGEGIGSGFLVHSSRLMVTNYHVIARASQAVAIQRRPDGSEGIRRAVQGFVACEPRADLVLLVLADEWPGKPLALAPATTPPGTHVFAVGSPHGLVGTVTRGIVSQTRKAGELEHHGLAPRTTLVQTDTFFSRGSSGGPLCDEQGRVVGITAFGISFSDEGTSSDKDVFRFAIAADEVEELIQRRTHSVRPLSQLPRSTR